MSTDTKTEANRANAMHSTGPRTEEGKAKSSQNARKHGLSARSLFVPEDRAEEFNSLFTSLLSEMRPIGELQSQYFEQLVHASWHTQLAREFVAAAYAAMDENKIVTFTRLLGQHERAFGRAHKALQQLQTDFALRLIEDNEPIADLPAGIPLRPLTNEATRLASSHERTQRAERRAAILHRIGAAFRGVPAAPSIETSNPREVPTETPDEKAA